MQRKTTPTKSNCFWNRVRDGLILGAFAVLISSCCEWLPQEPFAYSGEGEFEDFGRCSPMPRFVLRLSPISLERSTERKWQLGRLPDVSFDLELRLLENGSHVPHERLIELLHQEPGKGSITVRVLCSQHVISEASGILSEEWVYGGGYDRGGYGYLWTHPLRSLKLGKDCEIEASLSKMHEDPNLELQFAISGGGMDSM